VEASLGVIHRQAVQLRADWNDLKHLQLTQRADLKEALDAAAKILAEVYNKLLNLSFHLRT